MLPPAPGATFKQPVRKKCALFGFAGFFDVRVVWVQARSSATGLNSMCPQDPCQHMVSIDLPSVGKHIGRAEGPPAGGLHLHRKRWSNQQATTWLAAQLSGNAAAPAPSRLAWTLSIASWKVISGQKRSSGRTSAASLAWDYRTALHMQFVWALPSTPGRSRQECSKVHKLSLKC